ncbi:hypothetical protein CPB86DRAFT_58296 [Serendipita vermifera]|nr:hypothetical protein CPB86DRAFT_58296 [Serendipita vermifera]
MRAKSNELCVGMECPLPFEMLAVLVSRKSAICSLTITSHGDALFSDDVDGIYKAEFRNLNMRSINKLEFEGVPCEDAEMIMDQALESTCREMTVGLDTDLIRPTFLKHEIMQRAKHWRVWSCMDEPFTAPKLLLPNIETVSIGGTQSIYDALDIVHSKVVTLSYSGTVEESIDPTSLPIQLRDLFLTSDFTSRPSHPHPLVQLTTLDLRDVNLEYPLQAYIALPKLKSLGMWRVSFRYSGEDEDREDQDPDLFRDLPELRTLSIERMTIGRSVASVLRSCQQLESLTLKECEATPFLESFLECLSSREFFQSLGTFRLSGSVPGFDGFAALCAAQRPDLNVSF